MLHRPWSPLVQLSALSSDLGARHSVPYTTPVSCAAPARPAAETGRGRAQTSLYGECETAAKVHSRFCGFFRAPELPASSSHHTRVHRSYTGTRGVMYTAVHGIQRDRALCMLLQRSLLLLLLPRLLLLLLPPPRLLLRCCCRCWSTRRTGRAHLRARPLSVVRGSNPHAPSAVGAARAAAAADRQRRLQRRRGRWPRAGC